MTEVKNYYPGMEGSVSFNGNVTMNGLIVKHVSKSANYTATTSDFIIGVDTSSSAVTVTLDSDLVSEGRVIIINDEGGNAGTNNITVATEGSEKIDGNATATISTDNASLRLYSDGTNWYSF